MLGDKMKKLIWLTLLFPLTAYAVTQINNDVNINGNVFPRVTGKDLGDTTRRWDAWLSTINGVAVVPYEPAITAGTTLQYWRGDKSFQTLNTLAVPELTNLYFTDTRARTASVADSIADAVTNIAPSQNAVFDALALKADDSAVVKLAGTQTVTGAKTFSAASTINLPAIPQISVATTGNIDALDTSANVSIRLTGAAPVLRGIANGSNGKLATIINASGVSVSVNNENATPTAANRIITGTGADLTLENTASLFLQYDSTSSRWRVIGGSGGGGGGGGDVVGPASATDNAIARFDLATGKIIQNSVVTVGDTGIIAGATLPAASVSYTPTTPANWLSVPTQGQQAFDNLAAQRPVINLMSEWQTFTPTIDNLGTITGVVARKRRVGNNMEILVGANAGTPAASALAITIPDGLTVDTNATKANVTGLGYAQGTFTTTTWSGTGITQTAFRDGATFTKIFFGYSGLGGSWNKGNGNDLTSTGNGFLMNLSIPIAEWTQATTVDIFEAGDYGWTPYTPTYSAGLGTVTNSSVFHKRVGDELFVKGKFTPGTTSGSVATVSLPTGLTIDASKLPSMRVVGNATGNQGASWQPVTIANGGETVIKFKRSDTGSSTAAIDGNILASSGNDVSFYAMVPISGWSTFPIGVATQGTTLYRAAIGRGGEAVDCNASPCTVYISAPNTTWITSATRASAGNYTVNFNSGTFTNSALCTAVASNSIRMMRVIRSGTSSVNIISYNDAGSPSDTAFNIHCVDGGT